MDSYTKEISKLLEKRKEYLHTYKYLDLIKDKINKYKNVCIFPMGVVGKAMCSQLKNYDINVDFFCDNNIEKIGMKHRGVKCISIKDLIKVKEDTLVIIASGQHREIYKQLLEDGFSDENLDVFMDTKVEIDEYIRKHDLNYIKDNIDRLLDILEDEKSKNIVKTIIECWVANEFKDTDIDKINDEDQYFNKEVVSMSDEEIFVDIGCYDGDTLQQFLKQTENKFKGAFLFELDKKIFLKLDENLDKIDEETKNKIKTYNYGISNKDKTIKYFDGDSNSSIRDNGNVEGKITTLDKILNNKMVTFIKMDIEGCEMDALYGAQNTIQCYKPKLAICIYHKAEDLWQIPLYIKSIVPDYKIYIRHHTNLLYETVCYAIPR